jgi:tetratricopeptide (TPR) repeat protein
LRRATTIKLRSLCGAFVLAGLLAPRIALADEAGEVRRLMRQGDLTTALQRAEAAVAAQPQNAELRFLQGLILVDQQSDAAALAVFTRLAQEFPELPEPQNNLAYLHARAGQWEAARVALETALRFTPDQRLMRENLGDVHLQLALQAWARAGVPDATVQRKLRLGRDLSMPATVGIDPVAVAPPR